MSNQKPFWCWRSKFWKFEIQSADWLTPFSYRVDNKWLTILTPVTCFIPFQSSNWNFRSVIEPEVTGNELFLPSKWLSDLFFEKSAIWYSTSIIDARGNATGGYPHIVSFNFYGFQNFMTNESLGLRRGPIRVLILKLNLGIGTLKR